MADASKRPIYIVRKKVVAGGHHGGAWKVAYADFVTAMMAFFLVMWLITTVSDEQRAAIFDYFKNPSLEDGTAPKPAPGMNGPGGASTAAVKLRGAMDAPQTGEPMPGAIQERIQPSPASMEDARKMAEADEKAKLAALMRDIKSAIEKTPSLAGFKNQLLLDLTPEGLRIQIVDAQNRAMFDRGSTRLQDYTTVILHELAKYLATVPNRLSLSGHTDTTQYAGSSTFTNWELSAERANAARRALLEGGLPEEKVARVVGMASSVLFNPNEPTAAINRRISIIVMTKKAEAAALAIDNPTARLDTVPAAGLPPGVTIQPSNR
jgi:chemotaxis protein MotB